MKCKDCDACMKNFWPWAPGAYICIGVKEPFVISDINQECTEYPDKKDQPKTTTDIELHECYQILAKAKELKIQYCQKKGLPIPAFDVEEDYWIPAERELVKEYVEVVRCKDCEHYARVKGAVGGWSDCTLSHDDMDPDDFCSRGIRRANNA